MILRIIIKIIAITILAIMTELIKVKNNRRVFRSLWLTLLQIAIIVVGGYVASIILVNPDMTLKTANDICNVIIVINAAIILINLISQGLDAIKVKK